MNSEQAALGIFGACLVWAFVSRFWIFVVLGNAGVELRFRDLGMYLYLEKKHFDNRNSLGNMPLDLLVVSALLSVPLAVLFASLAFSTFP